LESRILATKCERTNSRDVRSSPCRSHDTWQNALMSPVHELRCNHVWHGIYKGMQIYVPFKTTLLRERHNESWPGRTSSFHLLGVRIQSTAKRSPTVALGRPPLDGRDSTTPTRKRGFTVKVLRFASSCAVDKCEMHVPFLSYPQKGASPGQQPQALPRGMKATRT
jgi:hypothetical protein